MNSFSLSKRHFSHILASILAFPAISGAVPLDFAPADTLLAVQASGGTGSRKNILVNLGPSVSFRDGTNPVILGNISTDLRDTFGPNWFARTDLLFGVYANRTNLSGIAGAPTGNEDTQRVVYVSRAATTPGSATSWGTSTSNGLSFATTQFSGVKRIFVAEDYLDPRLEITPTTTNTTILSEVDQSERWLNSWTIYNPDGGPAFDTWTGGVEGRFGQGGSRVLVDVQRVQPGVAATYVVTIAIESDGTIRALEPTSSATALETWVATFPALVSSANAVDRTPAGDFDKDGIPNTREFAFGGSPVSATDNGKEQLRSVDANADTLRDFTQTVEVRSGGIFSPSGNKLTAAVDGIIYTIEGSLDLVTFNSVVSEVTPTLGTGTPKAGYVFKTFRLNAANGLNGKGFIRVGAAASAN